MTRVGSQRHSKKEIYIYIYIFHYLFDYSLSYSVNYLVTSVFMKLRCQPLVLVSFTLQSSSVSPHTELDSDAPSAYAAFMTSHILRN